MTVRVGIPADSATWHGSGQTRSAHGGTTMATLLRLGSAVALALLWAGVGHAEPSSGKYALLVGCTSYDHLERGYHLEGPANDIVLFRDVLKRLYGFRDQDIA